MLGMSPLVAAAQHVAQFVNATPARRRFNVNLLTFASYCIAVNYMGVPVPEPPAGKILAGMLLGTLSRALARDYIAEPPRAPEPALV